MSYDSLTEDQKTQYREAFGLFDKDRDGKISTAELGTVMRCLGQSPTEAQLLDIVDQEDPKKTGLIEFKQFCGIMARRGHVKQTSEEIIEAFKIFDRDASGKIPVSELRHIMGNLGERLTEQEVEDMIQQAEVDGEGNVRYEQLVKVMMSV
jgi:calmodulin